MRHARLFHLLLASVFVAPSASATPTLLAIGELNGISDLSGLSGLLENGVAGDVLGGLGSGLAYAGGTTFLALPDRGPNAVGNTEISGNTSGRTANKGMEGLALTPDGKTLVGVMQAALIQDNVNPTKNLVRIVTIDIATGATKEFGYKLTTGSGVSEIVAINDHEFLIDERDGKGLGDGSVAVAKQLFKIDLTGATDITGLSGTAALNAAVGKTLFLDLVSALTAAGITADKIPSKIEGMAFGQDLIAGGVVIHTLLISNDNDFTPDLAGPNTIYAFGFTDADLNYVPEAFASETPLPASFVLFGTGLLGVAGARWRFGRRVSAQQSGQ